MNIKNYKKEREEEMIKSFPESIPPEHAYDKGISLIYSVHHFVPFQNESIDNLTNLLIEEIEGESDNYEGDGGSHWDGYNQALTKIISLIKGDENK